MDATSNGLTPKQQLMRFYRTEFNLLAGEVCSKLKIISEQILNDDEVRSSSSPIIKEMKKNLTLFQNRYPYYVRFGLNVSLATEFSNMVYNFYVPHEFYLMPQVVIKQLLKHAGYDDLRQEYQTRFKNFYEKKFFSRFQQLKSKISDRSELERFENRFSKCFAKARECTEYECLLTNFRNNGLKLRDKFIGNVQRHMLNMYITILCETKTVMKRVCAHPKFRKLDQSEKQNLLQFAQLADANFTLIDNLQKIFNLEGKSITESFLVDQESGEQKQLMKKIFDDSDGEKPLKNYIKNVLEFVQNGFMNEVENFKASFQTEGTKDDVPIMEMLKEVDHSDLGMESIIWFKGILEREQLKPWKL